MVYQYEIAQVKEVFKAGVSVHIKLHELTDEIILNKSDLDQLLLLLDNKDD